MARIVITIEDSTPGGSCRVTMDADPPINDPDETTNTMAQRLAIGLMAYMARNTDGATWAAYGDVDELRELDLRRRPLS